MRNYRKLMKKQVTKSEVEEKRCNHEVEKVEEV
jgi:hypothetical protein